MVRLFFEHREKYIAMSGSWENKETCYDRHCKLMFFGTDENIKCHGHIEHEKFMQKTVGCLPGGDVYSDVKDSRSPEQFLLEFLPYEPWDIEDGHVPAVAWTSVHKGHKGRRSASRRSSGQKTHFIQCRQGFTHSFIFFVLHFKFQIVKIWRFIYELKSWHSFKKLEGEE